jgi:uncharacterized membrane protein
MSFIILIVLFAVLGAGLGVLFNILVIKNFPEHSRTMSYVKTVIVFLLMTVILFSAVFGKFKLGSIVNDYSNKLELDITRNYPNLDFVKNGVDMTAVSNDITKLNKTLGDLNVIIKPKADELGIPNFIYNLAMDNVIKELQKKLAIVNAAGKAATSFVDERNYLTIPSLINGLRLSVLKIINIIVFVIVVICVIILGIYILNSLSRASKERKRKESETAG